MGYILGPFWPISIGFGRILGPVWAISEGFGHGFGPILAPIEARTWIWAYDMVRQALFGLFQRVFGMDLDPFWPISKPGHGFGPMTWSDRPFLAYFRGFLAWIWTHSGPYRSQDMDLGL